MREANLKEYIDNTVKELLKPKLREDKKISNRIHAPIKENIQSIKKNYKLLREYMEYENNAKLNGDEMLDNEISAIDTGVPTIDKFIENIKSQTLDAMMQLSKNGESNTATFETLKKVFDICHNTQKKGDKKTETE